MSLIIILSGNPGTGKTLQSILHKDGYGKRKLLIDIEQKAESTYQVNKTTDPVDIWNPYEHNEHFEVDWIKSHNKLESKINEIMRLDNYDIIILDSINHLRNPFYKNYHMKLTNTKGVPEEAWRKVSQYVQDIIMPLAQYCRVRNKTLIITSHLKEEWIDGNMKGYIPDIKKWAEHLGDIILLLESKGDNEYSVNCLRSPKGKWRDDLSGNTSLDIVLEERGLI